MKITISLALVASLALLACSSDEDECRPAGTYLVTYAKTSGTCGDVAQAERWSVREEADGTLSVMPADGAAIKGSFNRGTCTATLNVNADTGNAACTSGTLGTRVDYTVRFTDKGIEGSAGATITCTAETDCTAAYDLSGARQ